MMNCLFFLSSDIVRGFFDSDVNLGSELQGELFQDQVALESSLIKQENQLPKVDDIPVEENFDLVNFANGRQFVNDNKSPLNSPVQSVPTSFNFVNNNLPAVQPQIQQVPSPAQSSNILLQKPQRTQVQAPDPTISHLKEQQQTTLQLSQLLQMQNDTQQQQIEELRRKLRESEVKTEEQVIVAKRTTGSRQIQLHSQLAQHLTAPVSPPAATVPQQKPPPSQQPQQQHQLLKLQLSQHSPKPLVKIKQQPQPLQIKQAQQPVISAPLQIQIAASTAQQQSPPQTRPAHIIVQHVPTVSTQSSQPQQIIIQPSQPQPTVQTNIGQVTVQQLQQVCI